MTADILPYELVINRELSWIRFNERVLAQALDPRTPLLEQAKFNAIFSNNLDEFFMVRVASLQAQQHGQLQRLSRDGRTPLQQLHEIRSQLDPLLELQQQHGCETLRQELRCHGIALLNYQQLTRRQKDWANSYMEHKLLPVLTPAIHECGETFPFVSNLSLNIAALVRDPHHGQQQLIRIKLPKHNTKRFVQLPGDLHGGIRPTPHLIAVPSEQLVAANLQRFLCHKQVEWLGFFRVTRDADLELRELEADDLMQELERGLRKRRIGGEVVRLEVSAAMPDGLVALLMDGMQVKPLDVYRIKGWLGLGDLMELLTIPAAQLKDKAFQGRTTKQLKCSQASMLEDGSIKKQESESIFAVLRRGDVLLHHPFDLFSTSVEEFINQAADDASVLAIKITLYRVSKDSPIISALIRAAENGKQVMALVELKARFDEDNNIQWARQLERSGVHVVYGVMGLKTHTKLILVMRQERTGLRGYVHVGTGNYNSKTATLYTDLGLLSCRQNLIDDAIELFNSLTGYSKQHEYRSLLVAPGSLRQRMQELIQRETEHAQAGRPAAIRAKMNALVDPTIIALLYEASKAGVQIDLVVRGICSLRPGLAGVSETIRVRSIIDRFLEHSRLFWFSNAGAAEIYLGSADWMERNLDRRVEAVVPVKDPGLRCQLEHLLKLYLEDNSSAWQMDGTGRYERCRSAGIERRAQDELMATWPDMLQR